MGVILLCYINASGKRANGMLSWTMSHDAPGDSSGFIMHDFTMVRHLSGTEVDGDAEGE
jgi:hypothetical protein